MANPLDPTRPTSTLGGTSIYSPEVIGQSQLPPDLTLFKLAIAPTETGHLVELNDAHFPYHKTLCGRRWNLDWDVDGEGWPKKMCLPCEKKATFLSS